MIGRAILALSAITFVCGMLVPNLPAITEKLERILA